MTEKAPAKPCINAKIDFTRTALICLQPEAHKLCVWSWGTKTTYAAEGLDIQQAMLSGQNQLLVLLVMLESIQ